jgi:phage terminase large subunit
MGRPVGSKNKPKEEVKKPVGRPKKAVKKVAKKPVPVKKKTDNVVAFKKPVKKVVAPVVPEANKKSKGTIDMSKLDECINQKFYRLLWDDHRYLVLYGGAGSGKSVFAGQKLVARTMLDWGSHKQKHKWLCVRKVASTIRESQFAMLRSVIEQWGMTSLFSIPKGTGDMTITHITSGTQFIFAGLDDVEKLKSITDISGIWVEEPSEISEEDFTQLDLRLRGGTATYKQIILTFNPIIAGHWLDKYFFHSPKELALCVHSTYKDNEFIDKEYKNVIEGLKTTNPAWYKVYGLGEWGTFEGQFFSMWDAGKHVCKPFKVPKEWKRYRSLDWGSYRPYAVGWYAIDYDGVAWKYRELYGYGGKANQGTKETAQQVAVRIKKIEEQAEETDVMGVADPACWIKTGSSGPSIIEDFFAEGVRFYKAPNDRIQGWEQYKSRLIGQDDKPWLKVFDTCVHTIRTIPMMAHDKTRPEDMDSDLEDHICDCDRYFCMARPWKPEMPQAQAKKRDRWADAEKGEGGWMGS